MAQLNLKTCVYCGQDKPLTEYYNEKSRRDGKRPYCKPCDKDNRKKNKQKAKIPPSEVPPLEPIEIKSKICTGCNIRKRIKHYNSVDDNLCKQCTRDAIREEWKRQDGRKKCKMCLIEKPYVSFIGPTSKNCKSCIGAE